MSTAVHWRGIPTRLLFVLTTLSAAIGVAGFAQALEAAGTAVAVDANTEAAGAIGRRALETDGSVYRGDLITTDAGGQAQILFRDETKLVVGPNSNIKIDSFVYRPDNTASNVALNAARGAFRFISGISSKDAYKVTTPVATIGFRGTEVDFSVDEEGKVSFIIYDGTVRICTRERPRRRCALLEGYCKVITLDRQWNVEWLQQVYARTDYIAENLPYAFYEYLLQQPFQVGSNRCLIQELHIPEEVKDDDDPSDGDPPDYDDECFPKGC